MGRSKFPSPPHPSAVWAVTGHPIFNTACPLAVTDHCCDTHSGSKIYCKKVEHTPVITLTALFSSTHFFIYVLIAIFAAVCVFLSQGITPCSDMGNVCGPACQKIWFMGKRREGKSNRKRVYHCFIDQIKKFAVIYSNFLLYKKSSLLKLELKLWKKRWSSFTPFTLDSFQNKDTAF